MAAGDEVYDIVVIGAGISSIATAYQIQQQLPGYRYTILEARDAIGGTWTSFRFPGVRIDSDSYTYAFSWKPFRGVKNYAPGEEILDYIQEAVAEQGIDKNVQLNHKVVEARWSSSDARWTLTVDADGATKTLRTRFVFWGTGQYNYTDGPNIPIPGLDDFQGQVIHPQWWPEEADCTDKNIVVIGSGATAVTVVPALVKTARHVTMLQRSPSYIAASPMTDGLSASLIAGWPSKILPYSLVALILRLKFWTVDMLLFRFCTGFPNAARGIFQKLTTAELPKGLAHDPDFAPAYGPWQQRLCRVPDGDFFQALRDGRASVVTDTIRAVDPTGVRLASGKRLDADILVVATGNQLRFLGGARIILDSDDGEGEGEEKGTQLRIRDKFLWNNTFIQDVPNAALMIGYTSQSWTLAAECSATTFVRVVKHMRDRNLASVRPRVDPGVELPVKPALPLSSGYITRGKEATPKVSDRVPWRQRSSWLADRFQANHGSLVSGMEYR